MHQFTLTIYLDRNPNVVALLRTVTSIIKSQGAAFTTVPQTREIVDAQHNTAGHWEVREADNAVKPINTQLLEALRALTDWGREHTSPRDPNSPHDLLIRAVEVIAEADKYELPDETAEEEN